MSLRKHRKESFRPITKMSLCHQLLKESCIFCIPHALEYAMLGYTFLALVSGCRGNNVYFALSAPRQDRELDEPLCRILFVLLGDLRVDSSSAAIALGRLAAIQ